MKIASNFERSLQEHGQGNSRAAEFARNIESEGNRVIYLSLGSEICERAPDGQFKHLRAQFPGMVFEIANTQKPKNLTRRAIDFIRGSDGQIRVVLGIDLGGPPRYTATVSLWQARFTKEGIVIENTIKNRVRITYPFMNISLTHNR